MRITDYLLNLLFPPKCVSCGEVIACDKTDALCAVCCAKYVIEKGFCCPECGGVHAHCDCMPKTLSASVDEALHLTEYTSEESVARRMVLTAKDGRLEYLYRMLTSELATLIRMRIREPQSCLFAFVPRSRKRIVESGVDQAREVARRLAREFGADFESLFCQNRASEQKHLSAEERRANRANAYRIDEKKQERIKGRHIILYDDVITTGATLGACARQLKKAGAKSVTVVTFGKVYLGNTKEKSPILKSKRSL